MKKTIISICCIIMPGALIASRVINMGMEETVKRSPLIVVGTVTDVSSKADACTVTTLVKFNIKETLKGTTEKRTGSYRHSIYNYDEKCDQISYKTYPSGKTFTREDIGTDAIFYFCFSPDISHCCDNMSARERLIQSLKKDRSLH